MIHHHLLMIYRHLLMIYHPRASTPSDLIFIWMMDRHS